MGNDDDGGIESALITKEDPVWYGQLSVQFVCLGRGATIREILEDAPSYDPMADRGSDAKGFCHARLV